MNSSRTLKIKENLGSHNYEVLNGRVLSLFFLSQDPTPSGQMSRPYQHSTKPHRVLRSLACPALIWEVELRKVVRRRAGLRKVGPKRVEPRRAGLKRVVQKMALP